MGLHVVPLHQPKTPKLIPPNSPSGICCMIGVDRTEIRSRPKARRSRIDKGVAGRSIVAEVGRRLGAQVDFGGPEGRASAVKTRQEK